jgi:hypothetical protein
MYYITVTSSAATSRSSARAARPARGSTPWLSSSTSPTSPAGDLLTNYVPGYNFKIEAFDFRVGQAGHHGRQAGDHQPRDRHHRSHRRRHRADVGELHAAGAPSPASRSPPTTSADSDGQLLDRGLGVTAFVEGNGWMIVRSATSTT